MTERTQQWRSLWRVWWPLRTPSRLWSTEWTASGSLTTVPDSSTPHQPPSRYDSLAYLTLIITYFLLWHYRLIAFYISLPQYLLRLLELQLLLLPTQSPRVSPSITALQVTATYCTTTTSLTAGATRHLPRSSRPRRSVCWWRHH